MKNWRREKNSRRVRVVFRWAKKECTTNKEFDKFLHKYLPQHRKKMLEEEYPGRAWAEETIA